MTPTASASVFSLTQYQGKNRIVLVFTPSDTDDRFLRQQALFDQHRTDLKERDLLVIPIIGSTQTRMRSQFRVSPNNFAVVLVGKDGTEKHRWDGIAPVSQINHRIDRMPMRRVEMRSHRAATGVASSDHPSEN